MTGRHRKGNASPFSRLALGLILAAATGGCLPQPKPEPHVITVWQPFDASDQAALDHLVREFERTHPGIKVKMSFASNDLTSSQKLFLAIAGGVAPDVTFVDGQQLSEWAARGALADLTDSFGRSGLKPEDFWEPRWKESTFRGHVYAMPWGADPNFAFIWNKDLFRNAGLDPDHPPKTIAELDNCIDKLTIVDRQGNITSLGLNPWEWTGANCLFTWGYAFGGNFYTEPDASHPLGTVTADNPGVVKALDWMARFGRKYDVRKVTAYDAQMVGIGNTPFYAGKSAMRLLHVSQIKDLHRYAPTMDIGIGLIPAPPDGEYPNGWIGGWSLAVPRNRDVRPEAFEFIKWMCTSKEATDIEAVEMEQFPAYAKSPAFARLSKDPVRGVFYQILSHAKHVRTLMPVQGYYMERLGRAIDEVLYGGMLPKEALERTTEDVSNRLQSVADELAQHGTGAHS
ncbi:MAG: ABC transporter substrate-binding protein [Fimbriimonas sp.]|nr:ABC transporter substrate-binding protein [Fimbriimonas sp.]